MKHHIRLQVRNGCPVCYIKVKGSKYEHFQKVHPEYPVVREKRNGSYCYKCGLCEGSLSCFESLVLHHNKYHMHKEIKKDATRIISAVRKNPCAACGAPPHETGYKHFEEVHPEHRFMRLPTGNIACGYCSKTLKGLSVLVHHQKMEHRRILVQAITKDSSTLIKLPQVEMAGELKIDDKYSISVREGELKDNCASATKMGLNIKELIGEAAWFLIGKYKQVLNSQDETIKLLKTEVHQLWLECFRLDALTKKQSDGVSPEAQQRELTSLLNNVG